MKFTHLAVCISAVIGLASTSQADPIDILNASFEEPPFNSSFSSSATGTDWNFGGGRGRYNYTFYGSNTAPTGDYVAYSNGSGNNIVQEVATLEAYSLYTYSIMVGDGPGAAYGGYELDLEVYNETTAAWEAVASEAGASADMAGLTNDFFEATLTFETTDSLIGAGGQELIGGDLRVKFSGGDGVQTVFDDISLDVVSTATAVPEPGTVAIWLIVGAVGLLGFARRKRGQSTPATK